MNEIGGVSKKIVTTEQWQKVKTLFAEALKQEPSTRAEFVTSPGKGDDLIRDQVERMLRDYDEAADFLEAPLAINTSDIIAIDESLHAIGRMIGPYRITREIGRGGMSVVYLAGRADDLYFRQVAVKVIWPGLMTDEIERRFRQERRILAKLDHPHIARLLDGGVTEDGCQYVVMEYVEGKPITEFCDARRLPISERLKLFQQICAAVQYAHDNLIVHRDLKPSNILVSGDGTVKLLDFGIAKLLDPALLGIEDSPPSRAGVQAMTPEYASPEQARGDDITTASDIYSLGVVLYELLAGHRPYRINSRLPQEAAQVISEKEPLPPSVIIGRVAEIADDDDGPDRSTQSRERISELRDCKPDRLRARLQGDLDNIVAKALRKEPFHRYRSAGVLSEDIARHLQGEPVVARKGTLIYLTTRFVRRHKVGVAGAGFVLLLLLAAIIYFVAQTRVAKAQARRQLRWLYAADMRQAGQDLIDRNLGRARELVERHQAPPGSQQDGDWRGFEWYYLRKALYIEQVRLQHATTVSELVITPEGKRLFVGAHNGQIEIWDTAASRMTGVLADLREEVRVLALSPDGKRLASTGEDQTIRIWDIETGLELLALKGHTNRVWSLAFSSDGRLLVSSGKDRTVRLWRTATEEEINTSSKR
jgi:serine/threonine protein kinase